MCDNTVRTCKTHITQHAAPAGPIPAHVLNAAPAASADTLNAMQVSLTVPALAYTLLITNLMLNNTFNWFDSFFPCQHDDGCVDGLDGRSQIKVQTDERTQAHSALAFSDGHPSNY